MKKNGILSIEDIVGTTIVERNEEGP
jgi:hypothetical protein